MTWLLRTKTKWQTFFKRTFQWICLNFDKTKLTENYTEIYFKSRIPMSQYIAPDNGLARNRRQDFTWSNHDPIQLRVYTSPLHNELKGLHYCLMIPLELMQLIVWSGTLAWNPNVPHYLSTHWQWLVLKIGHQETSASGGRRVRVPHISIMPGYFLMSYLYIWHMPPQRRIDIYSIYLWGSLCKKMVYDIDKWSHQLFFLRIYVDVIFYPCHNLDAGLVNSCQ